MPADPTKAIEVFYSYAHEDELLRDKLKKQLASLKRQGVISEWYDRDISPGNEWNDEIERHLNSASVILLLISPDFIDSDYCNDVEVKRAMERHEEGTAVVVPVIVRPTSWKRLPFSKLQALPRDGHAVTSWPNEDEAFLDVAHGIEKALNELKSTGSLHLNEGTASRLSPLAHIEPQSAVGFVTRKDRDGNDIVQQLRTGLAPNSGRVIALWGGGGVGKTALAAEAVRSLISSYQQRVVWISADGRDEFALTNLLDEITNQLAHPEIRTLSIEAKKEAVQELVRVAPTLVVFDNFETVKAKEQSACLDWVSHISPSSALITTRAKIELHNVRNIPIESMLVSEAKEFLDRLILQAQNRQNFGGVDKERLIETAEANPLILQWIFAQVDLAQDWHDVLEDLAQGEGDAANRVFDRSFNLPLLNNGGRAALLGLSLFVPSASRSALAEVAALDGTKNKKKFKDATKHLAALWLIKTAEGGARLTIEGLTRDLAKARLGSDQRSLAIRQRFITRFFNFVGSNSRETASDLNSLETERENILAAIDLALATKRWRSAIDIYVGIASFCQIRGYWDDIISRGDKIRNKALEIDDKYALGSAAETIGNTRTNRGEYVEAEQSYIEALDAYKDLKVEEYVAGALHNLGVLVDLKGDSDRARTLFNESLEIDRNIGNQNGVASNLSALASLAEEEGDITEAHRLFSESLKIHRESDNPTQVSVALHNLGTLYERQGHVEKARQLYLESLAIDEKLRNQSAIAHSQITLGSLAREQGQVAEALKLFENSMEIQKKLGIQSGISRALHELGLTAHQQGKLTEARQLYMEALEIQKRINVSIAADLHDIGRLDLDEGRVESAKLNLGQSLVLLRRSKVKSNIAECLETLGDLETLLGNFEAAHAFYGEALEIGRTSGYQLRIANVKHRLGLLAEKETQPERAKELLQEALQMFNELHSHRAEKAKADLVRLEKSTSLPT